MAKILNKDPVTYERERESFLKELHHFHETRGTSFKKAPKISGNEIDLYLLYVLVTAHGGWIKVNTRNEWSLLCEQFYLPAGCVNSGVGLKQIYLRYLDRYEKVHFLGEDGHQGDDDDEDSRHRKWSARSLHSVPLTYNHHQHNVAESLREYNGLSSNLYKPSNCDKLALSLLSPLPNEQDFAINVCALLSNEGKFTLRLDKSPRLINILLAHAGVFDSPGTRQLFIEVYSRVRNYSVNSFWSDVLDSPEVLDLTNEKTFMKKPIADLNTFSRRKFLEREKDKKSKKTSDQINQETPMEVEVQEDDSQRLETPSIIIDDDTFTDQNQNSIKFEEEDKDLFCVGRTLGTQDPYGQRVLQIASIFRELSFTPENAAVLGRNRCFLRFVLLCVRARWSNLHQLGFDILGNIANEMILKEAGERLTDCVLTCIANGITSSDRFIVISCLEVLNKISQQDSNEEIVTYGLKENVYELICRFLALSDIALLVYTLECLYALTSLGERPCTSIARVRGAIDTLVALITVEAQSYGPKACILMRVVETVSTLSLPTSSTGGQTTTVSNTVNTTVNTTSVATVTTSTVAAVPITTPSVATAASTVVVVAAATAAPATSPAPSRPSTPATPSSVTSKANSKASVEAANSLQQQHAHQQIIQENEQFALGWLRITFELATGGRIEQEELYKKYLGCCTKIGRRGVIAPLHFPRCVRSVFGGTVGPNPIKGETTGTQYYEGIRVRSTTTSVTLPSQNTVLNATSTTTVNSTPVKVLAVQQRTVTPTSPNPDSTGPELSQNSQSTPASSILKAHLSAPPKPTTNLPQTQNPVTKVDSKSQVSVAHPHLSQALLATGSQTNQQQHQQTNQQNQHSPMIKEESRAGPTASSIIKSLLATKVAQRQQQQRLLQQQLASGVQPAAPAATPASPAPVLKAPVNSKQKNVSNPTAGRKIQRLNGAKIIVANNIEKTEVNDNDSHPGTPTTSTIPVSTMTENHITTTVKVIRPLTSSKPNQRAISLPLAEDSDSTNNSLASSSGIGGSRDCSGVGAEEENSLTSFEGILLNGAPSSIDIDAQEDGSSKDSSGISTKEKPLMLADLLERKIEKEVIVNGVLGKNSINEKGKDLVENHIKKVLKDSTDVKIKQEPEENNLIQPEVSDNALIEPPRGMKRMSTDSDDLELKKPKYSNGTTSPEPTDPTAESTVSSIKSEKSEDQEDDKDSEQVKVSSTAANLYAALAADCIEDETDLEEPVVVKEEPVAPLIKEEPLARAFINNQVETIQPQPQPQQLIVTAPRQIVVQQAIQNNQMIIPGGQMKARANPSQPQVLLQQSAGGQLQYVVSGGVPGQNYVLAQSQTALVQGQAQTVLVAQTTQQQGTGTKTIIILQSQSAAQQAPQKMVAMTPQGQQVVVTQVPRPMIQSSIGGIPPPLVPSSTGLQQASIIVNSSVAQSNQGTVTVTIPTVAQQCPITSSVPSRVVTPTPASTPPPTRPTTPHQAAATHGGVKSQMKVVKAFSTSTSTSTEPENKPSTSTPVNTETKTITIKIDPNAYLCEWRGCLKQFKTAHEVYLHVCEAHCPTGPEEILCLWASCDGLKRRRFSLMTHLYDRHCNADSMTQRRKQLTAAGKTEMTTTTASTQHPGYAPNAAFHAIKRHALEFVNPKELMQRPTKPAATIASSSSPRLGQNPPPKQDDNEGPVTKSIRLTAALILRNLVIYSAHGRRHLRTYEPHLASVALSNVESSRTIAQILYDLNDGSNSSR
ncbi:AT-rich interactive domain-containing protein 2 isoform X2 [Fopius arisanus]|uniref:AT-rich interactive domain-containing protein 2 isoform X2 n=1 Tax=Fopius arisanus TaxID=64838 RepID=A0A9R1STW7_9HYME|nr:PREDICTED: AT-rich interactive domain-containing protein 2 isoform X2 [Fopius arisanus]